MSPQAAKKTPLNQRLTLAVALLGIILTTSLLLVFWVQQTRWSASRVIDDLTATQTRIEAAISTSRIVSLENRIGVDLKAAKDRQDRAEANFQREIERLRSSFRHQRDFINAAEELRDFVTGPLHSFHDRLFDTSPAGLESAAYDAQHYPELKAQQDRLLRNLSDEADQIAATERDRKRTAEITGVAALLVLLAGGWYAARLANSAGRDIQQVEVTAAGCVKLLREIQSFAEARRDSIEKLKRDMHSDGASPVIDLTMSTLEEKSARINLASGTLAKVADQSNLLSFNAAIEAEKAGEYGLGFAVIATEIRRLADQTIEATTEIEKVLNEMQSAMSSGISDAQTHVTIARNWREQGEQLRAEFTRILAEIDKLDGKLPPGNGYTVSQGTRVMPPATT